MDAPDNQKDKQVVLQQGSRNITVGKNDKVEAFLPQAHSEKAGFFGKDNQAGKNRRQQEKRKTKYEVDRLQKGSHRQESARTEQGW